MGLKDLSIGLKKGESYKVAHLELARNENSLQLKLAAFSSKFSIAGGL